MIIPCSAHSTDLQFSFFFFYKLVLLFLLHLLSFTPRHFSGCLSVSEAIFSCFISFFVGSPPHVFPTSFISLGFVTKPSRQEGINPFIFKLSNYLSFASLGISSSSAYKIHTGTFPLLLFYSLIKFGMFPATVIHSCYINTQL